MFVYFSQVVLYIKSAGQGADQTHNEYIIKELRSNCFLTEGLPLSLFRLQQPLKY